MSKKIFSMLLALVMVFSLVAPVIPVAAAAEPVSEPVSQTATPDLRVGVLSDIHVSYDYVDEVYGNVTGHFNGVQPSRFEKALRFFKAQGVEAVIVAGDLQEASGTDAANLDKQKDWLQTVVDIWFEVFPEAPGEEGYVEPVFIYGNHDSALIAEQYWPEEWGVYEDAFVKTVNGYSFVCSHNAKESYAANLLEKVAGNSKDKPIIYVQHCPVNNTVPGSTGGYGVGYGQTGRANLADYPNVVAFNGHTHAPLTDEKSIWQGDAGNEGQFTVINTATINYTGIGYDNDLAVNSYAGNAQQTEHGMIMDITGSQVSIDRYSFNDMTIDANTNAISGDAVKLGETWAWDACDVNDRPYAWDSRYENAHAPVFANSAALTVNSVTNTSVSVTMPAATLTAPAGFSDMISSYVVEACNPTSGEVEAVGRVATSYHVDDKPDVYEATYTVTVSGLQPGTKYILKAYAQEFFEKRSEPLTLEITTTGTLASYRRGDINKDGDINAADMVALEAILAAPSVYNYDGDIDQNGINETRDITALQAILDGEKIIYPETGDLMDLVTEVTLTGVSTSTNYQPVDYGTIIQNQVVRGDSNQAVKTWTTNYAYYPVTTMYFAEPVDLSGYTHISFDTLFENEYNLSDSYRKRWLSVSFVSGEQEQIASYGSMNFDANNEGWTTKTISLATLKNIDLTAVTAIRFSHNFDYYEGRYDGVTEHAIYWDNFYGLVIEGSDGDLLSGATVNGGEIVFGAGFTNNTNQAIFSTSGTLDFLFESEKVINDYASVKVDIRTPAAATVNVQALDANGQPIGKAVGVKSTNIYTTVNISVPAMELEENTVVAGLRFTYSCYSLLLDNMQLQGSKDYDLIGTATEFKPLGGSNCTALITTEGGNGSNNALYASAAPGTSVWSGGGELIYETPLDLSETPYLRFDMKVQNAHWAMTVVLYNSNGEEIYRTTHYNGTKSGGQYATYEFDLRSYRTYDNGYIYHEVTAEQLKDVAKISLTCDLASTPNWMVSDDTALREVWFDNLVACNPLEDFFGADTSLTKPSAVQDGFVCEIMPTTADGHTNVLHWYADSSKNAGTTSGWPGETIVTFTKDVNLMNHSGYNGSYDYLEFDIKTVGMYIAMYLTVKDANGATLGSTGEYRISYEQEWSTYRVDAAALKMSAEDFNKIAQVQIGWNWQHQDANGTAAQYMTDVYIDNMGLRSIDAESEDLLDKLSLIKNQDWWTGANGKFTGGGWKFQSDVTANSDKALMFYRSETSQNISYGEKTLYMYFNEPITLDSKWSLEIDAIKQNYNANGGTLQLIGSDGNKYTVFTFSHTEAGVHTYSTLVSAIAGFDPTTTTVTGLYFKYPMNPDNSMDKTANGYLALDNLNIAIPEPMDEDDFLYTATCSIGQNQTAVTNNSLSSWKLSPSSGWSYPQFVLANAADISNHTLTMDIMVTGMSTFRMHLATINGDWGGGVGAAQYYGVDRWITVSYDLSTNGAGITDMTAFSLGIECALAEGAEEMALYIDNVTLTDNDAEPEPTDPEPTVPEPTEPSKEETIEDDWIHMVKDAGMSENVTYAVVQDNTYGNSTHALKIETGSGYRLTFNPQSAVLNGALSEVVDMTKGGLIGGYFYFGDQTPSVKIRLTDKNWNGGASIELDKIDAGNGWYYCYKDVSQFYFYDGATNPTKAEIIRISVILPSDYTVYLDQFMYPTFIPAEHLDYRIVYNADDSNAVASDAAVRLQSDLEWIVDIVPDTMTAVENEIVLGDAGRTNATVASYLTGGANELGEFDYAIVVENGKIYLAANTNAGMYQALDKLVELASAGEIADGTYLKDAHDTTDTAALAEDADIRVMSYNVLYSTEHLVEDRIGNFLNILGYYKPDVIGLQETSAGSNAGWHEYIQDALVADGIYLKACKSSESVSGLMTTFLYNPDTVKLLDEYVIDLEEGSQIRVLSVAVFERLADGQQFVVTNTHPAPYGSVNYSPNLQAMLTAAAAELEKYADLPVIMVGDFNTDESDVEYQTIMNTLGVVDSKYAADTMVRAYNTWSGFGVEPIEGSDYCIDHIFVNSNVDAKLYNIVIDHDVENTSDHIPLYADLKLSVHTEPDVTEPPASPNPEDPGDLLGATNTISYNHNHWDNLTENATGLTGVVDTENVYGDVSTRSWAFKATAAANKSEAVAQMAMPYYYDLTGKMLVFDVKFDSTDAAQTMTLNTRLHETVTWADVTTNISKTLKAGYWQTVALDFSSNIVSGKDLTAVQFITFTMNFAANTGTERALYIDNVRLVDVEIIDDDFIHCRVDSGSTGNLYWLSDEYTYGDSSLSMRLENKTSGDNDIYYNTQSQYGNDNLPSFKNKIVSAYFYFGDQTPYATLQLVDKNWSGVIASGFTFESLGDGWYYGQVNTARITTHADTTDLSQCIRFAINIASGAVAYMDGLTVVDGESGADDWTNIWIDTGATKGAYGSNTEYTYGDSKVSMRFEPTGGSYISFHTQNEVNRRGGAWDAYPNFTSGIFSAYIYFGDQTPAVKLQLTDKDWKNSTSTAMKLEDMGDGWYHATLDVTQITVPDGFIATEVIRIYLTFTAGQKVYIDEMSLLPAPNCMEDHLGTSPGVRRPTSGIESGYVIEILDSYEGYSNVFHVAADPNNGSGTTTNWPDQPSYLVGESGANYSADEYDFYEFTFKGTGHYSDISVSFLDGNNITLGSVSGFRLSHKEADWMTFRINLTDAGLTAEEVKQVRRVSFGFNWQYQNASGTALLAADLYWRDCGFRSLNEDSTDLLDQIDNIRNKDYWYGGYNNYPGAGWYFDADGAFTFYRSTNTSGLGYADRNMYVYFKTPVSVESGERLSLDIVNTNFPLKSRLELIGSDGKYYTFGKADQKGSYNLTVCVNDLATSDGVVFDPATVTITGIKFYNNFNPDTNIDSTAGGTLAYTGLTVLEALPNALDDAIANYKSLTKPSAVEDGFVCEILAETDDGHDNVIHWYTDPNNGAGTTNNWPGTTKLYIDAIPDYVDTTEYDYLEFSYKHYGVKYWFSLTVYDTAGTKIGISTGKAHSGYTEWRTGNETGWATHRIDLDTMGLTAEELKTVGMFEISVSWEYNNVNGTQKYVGEMWIDDLRFGINDDKSTDMMDHIVETDIYTGNNATITYVGSDWFWNEDGAFTITRDVASSGWRSIRLYFNDAVTVESDWTVSLDFVINNFHHGAGISLLGSDGKVYSNALSLNKAGSGTVTKAMSSFATSDGTAFDPATVQIVGIHISYSLGTSAAVTDTTTGGYMSIDNLIFTDPSAE